MHVWQPCQGKAEQAALRLLAALLLAAACAASGAGPVAAPATGAAAAPGGSSGQPAAGQGVPGARPAAPSPPVLGVGGVRLAGGPDDASGRLELLVGGRWGAACTGALDGAAARVVCRQLGFSGGAVRGGAAYGGGGGPRLPAMLAAAACNGTEARLSDCRLRLSGHGAPSCPPKDAAGLDCSNAGVIFGARLVGRGSRSQGQLQVLVNGTWAGVCRNGFSAAAASAACRGLGFPLGGELAECAGCTLTAPLRVGWLACSANDSSLATCGYVALDPYIGGGGGTAKLAPGGRASSAASCIRHNLALGRSPAVALSCRAEAHGRGLKTEVIVGGALAATAAAMLAALAFYFRGAWRHVCCRSRHAATPEEASVAGSAERGTPRKPLPRYLVVANPDGRCLHLAVQEAGCRRASKDGR